MSVEPFLENVSVVELGDRIATALCGGLLQRLGASVSVVTPAARSDDPEAKWRHLDVLGAGKDIVDAGAGDAAHIVSSADIAILSTDWCHGVPHPLLEAAKTRPIVCDVTAFGSSGPLSGMCYTDAMMQAYAGLAWCTGDPRGDPIVARFPITELSTAVYAAAGVLAAMRARRQGVACRRVEAAMLDTSVSLLSTFLPAHFVGGAPTRIGNRHPSMSPWNAYPARDGWLLLCSASNDMWRRVCETIGRLELAQDPRFVDMAGRVRHAEEADACLRPWIAARDVEACVAAFTAANVPCGPVYAVADLMRDETLRARNAIVECADRGGSIAIPGTLVHGSPANGTAPGTPMKREPAHPWTPDARTAARPALHGVRVLEMGNYTTAPLAARQLGALGADVVKLDPPSGELSRASPPHRDGQSYFCTLSNSDKRSVVIDLASPGDRALFHELLARADVFVENMKPGVLARYGCGAGELRQRHPSLVYCSVSGFGAGTPLAERPAMDATIQGMAGVMDLTRSGGVPYKVGASICDILGGEFALLAVLAGLEFRARTGRGTLIDLSMQELAAWLTQLEWNGSGYRVPAALLAARDGHVVAIGRDAAGQCAAEAAEMSRDEMVAALTARGMRAAPLHSVSEAVHLDRVAARALVTTGDDRRGVAWPLLACPIRLPDLPRVERRAIGRVGEDRSDVLRDWGIEREKAGT